jgi:hypothetical protein
VGQKKIEEEREEKKGKEEEGNEKEEEGKEKGKEREEEKEKTQTLRLGEQELILLNDLWEFNLEDLRFSPIEITNYTLTTSAVFYQYLFAFKRLPQKEEGFCFVFCLFIPVVDWFNLIFNIYYLFIIYI